MIELNSTWNTIVMLLVAGGVGLLGGIGAAFIEWRQRCSNPAAAGSCSPKWSAISCIVLGGLAAVAILYFFPPTQEVLVPVEGKEPEKSTFYDLTKLVALALIVGTAGAAFLQALQTRTLAMAKAQRAETQAATSIAAVSGIPQQAKETIAAQIKSASTDVKTELQKSVALNRDEAEEIVEVLADQAADAVADTLQTQVETAQKVMEAGRPDLPGATQAA